MLTNPEAQEEYFRTDEAQPIQPPKIHKKWQARAMLARELCKDLDEEEECQKEEKKRKFIIKMKTSTRRSRRRQHTIRNYVNQYLRGKRNIIWTILSANDIKRQY